MDFSARHQTFRALLRQLRKEAGLSQVELAQKLNKPQSFVSKSENGERRVDFVEAIDICDACGITVGELEARLRTRLAEE